MRRLARVDSNEKLLDGRVGGYTYGKDGQKRGDRDSGRGRVYKSGGRGREGEQERSGTSGNKGSSRPGNSNNKGNTGKPGARGGRSDRGSTRGNRR